MPSITVMICHCWLICMGGLCLQKRIGGRVDGQGKGEMGDTETSGGRGSNVGDVKKVDNCK